MAKKGHHFLRPRTTRQNQQLAENNIAAFPPAHNNNHNNFQQPGGNVIIGTLMQQPQNTGQNSPVHLDNNALQPTISPGTNLGIAMTPLQVANGGVLMVNHQGQENNIANSDRTDMDMEDSMVDRLVANTDNISPITTTSNEDTNSEIEYDYTLYSNLNEALNNQHDQASSFSFNARMHNQGFIFSNDEQNSLSSTSSSSSKKRSRDATEDEDSLAGFVNDFDIATIMNSPNNANNNNNNAVATPLRDITNLPQTLNTISIEGLGTNPNPTFTPGRLITIFEENSANSNSAKKAKPSSDGKENSGMNLSNVLNDEFDMFGKGSFFDSNTHDEDYAG